MCVLLFYVGPVSENERNELSLRDEATREIENRRTETGAATAERIYADVFMKRTTLLLCVM